MWRMCECEEKCGEWWACEEKCGECASVKKKKNLIKDGRVKNVQISAV